MKKILACMALMPLLWVGCQKETEKTPEIPAVKTFKSAYINTVELMDKSKEAEAIEKKYKAESKEKGKALEAKINAWKSEAAQFQKNAQANGQEWAQRKGQELQQREQELGMAQQQILGDIQGKMAKELDGLKKKYKDIIKKYGKEKGLDYIYGTGDASSILYAKDAYDITQLMIDKINAEYEKK